MPLLLKLILGISLFFPPTLGSQSIFTTKEASTEEIGSLSSLSTKVYTRFTHSLYPHHAVRIKRTEKSWCDPSVNKYTGYIDITEARHLFFYFFESRNDPTTDPVMLWTNGGPGGSSATGLFMELGPCNVVGENETEVNEWSWNNKANIFFIDQPIGVGFSYADYGEFVSTTEESAVDIAAFVSIFFETFPQFKGREFHLSGESYAGRYLPVYASLIYEQNKYLKEPINLKSVLIGNGYTDMQTLWPSYYDMVCTPASLQPKLDIASCVRMKTALPRITKALKESCFDSFDAMNCKAAVTWHRVEVGIPATSAIDSPYDISLECDTPEDCYPEMTYIDKYLTNPSIQEILGLPPNTTFTSLSMPVWFAFNDALDNIAHKTQYYIEGLLDRGVDILVYVGSYDYSCNWVGNLRMVNNLEFNGSKGFAEKPLEEWRVKGSDGMVGGVWKKANGLTYLTVEGAGHLVPHDKPAAAWDMLNRWLSGEGYE